MKEKTKPARVPLSFEEKLLRAGDLRVSRGLMRARDVKLPKMIKLLEKSPAFHDALEQASSWPEKKKR